MEHLFAYNTQYSQYINENHITHLYTHLSPHLLIIPYLQSWAYICNSLITYYLEALTSSTHNTLEFMCTNAEYPHHTYTYICIIHSTHTVHTRDQASKTPQSNKHCL